jgi:hypothetical protein
MTFKQDGLSVCECNDDIATLAPTIASVPAKTSRKLQARLVHRGIAKDLLGRGVCRLQCISIQQIYLYVFRGWRKCDIYSLRHETDDSDPQAGAIKNTILA